MLSDTYNFREVIQRGVKKYNKRKLSKLFGVSKPTITRWIEGKNLPHKSPQHIVLRKLMDFYSDIFEKEI